MICNTPKMLSPARMGAARILGRFRFIVVVLVEEEDEGPVLNRVTCAWGAAATWVVGNECLHEDEDDLL